MRATPTRATPTRCVSTQVSGGSNIHGLLLQNGVNEPIDSTHPEKPLFVECFPWYQKAIAPSLVTLSRPARLFFLEAAHV